MLISVRTVKVKVTVKVQSESKNIFKAFIILSIIPYLTFPEHIEKKNRKAYFFA